METMYFKVSDAKAALDLKKYSLEDFLCAQVLISLRHSNKKMKGNLNNIRLNKA